MTSIAKQALMSYRVTDLEYDAVAISAGNVLGIYVSAGEAYSFGRSVDGGVNELKHYVKTRTASCPNTYWVLGGYSQGAMVVANSLEVVPENRLVYVMMFGDPKLYLPEGEGFNPPACRGENLSEYRMYAPDCDTDNGILGARKPYVLPGLEGRFGLWCNDDDFICGSSKNPLNTSGHSQYEENGSFYNASVIVLRRLRYLRSRNVLMGARGDSSRKLARGIMAAGEIEEEPCVVDSVLALLTQQRYIVEPGETIKFDATRSFNVDGGELEYAWFVDGVLQIDSGAHSSYQFNELGSHEVMVKVTDATGKSSTDVAIVRVGWQMAQEHNLPAPLDIYAERCGENRICLHWVRKRGPAQYLAVRVNDAFLGFVDIAQEELVVGDVDFNNVDIAVGYMDSEYELGEMAKLEIQGRPVEAVPTTAALPWWRILAIAFLPFGFLLLAWVVCRLVRNIADKK